MNIAQVYIYIYIVRESLCTLVNYSGGKLAPVYRSSGEQGREGSNLITTISNLRNPKESESLCGALLTSPHSFWRIIEIQFIKFKQNRGLSSVN